MATAPAQILEHDSERADGALEHRGKGHDEGEALGAQELVRVLRLGEASPEEVDGDPAREPVLPVPVAFA
jgi:hypothetical protein